MGSTNDSSNLDYTTGKYIPFPPPSFLPASASHSDLSEGGPHKSREGAINYHQRCSSESFLIDEEQPSWLDDLLNDTETIPHRGCHRRSASDSYAYFGEAVETFNVDGTTFNETKADLLVKKTIQESKEVVSSLAVEHSREEISSQNIEDTADRASGSQVKPPGSKADSKRSKQHNAHRSRVRKLQYITHLERIVQILKAEGSEVGAELEFVEQHNIILNMENRALRQRLESTSQEQIIKHWEQGILEREIGRLQNLYHMQKQQQLQQQQMPYSKHRRNRSKDLDHQHNTAPLKNKDATATKPSSVNGSFRI